ncbi:MAG: hypothetical protein WC284_13905 [Candidimonas sp.]
MKKKIEVLRRLRFVSVKCKTDEIIKRFADDGIDVNVVSEYSQIDSNKINIIKSVDVFLDSKFDSHRMISDRDIIISSIDILPKQLYSRFIHFDETFLDKFDMDETHTD